MLEYQQKGRFFAQVHRGLEATAGDELASLSATDIRPTFCGLHFSATLEDLARIVLMTRICSRILAPLASFSCHSDRKLYGQSRRQIPWERFLDPADRFFIVANVSDSRITHSRYAAQVLKDALVDSLRERYQARPSIDKINPSRVFNLFIHRNRAVVSLDLGSGALHRRRYRQETVSATLHETTAAALIALTGWQGERPLVDPFCGSGTLVAEALMSYCKIPPTWHRREFGLQALPDLDPAVFHRILRTVKDSIQTLPPGLIRASDHDAHAVSVTRTNLATLPQGKKIPLDCCDYRRRDDLAGTTIITNLPYGKRLSVNETFYRQLGDFLKQRCRGATAWLLCPHSPLIKSIGLRTSRKIPVFNGPLECRFIRLELY